MKIESGAFIPNCLYTNAGKKTPIPKGTRVKVLYLNFYCITNNKVIVTQYYHKNFTNTQVIDLKEFEKIEYNGKIEDETDLYVKTFIN